MDRPRIAVITPYHREPLAMLEQGHDSVRAQGVDADHWLIADGVALDAIDGWQARHVRLPQAHGDNGNTPRGIGSLLAERDGYDFIAYLDADNWFHQGHLAALLDLWRERRAPVSASLRTFHAANGAPLPVTEMDEDALRHVDTSCVLLHRDAFAVLPLWLRMPPPLSPICDRIFLAALLHARLAIASTGQRTVAFRTQYAAHYEAAGVPPPPGAKQRGVIADAFAWLRSAQGVTESVAALGFWPGTYLL